MVTALGDFVGVQAVAAHVWNRTDLKGLRIAIQGLGATGRDLARQLHEAGVKLVVADVTDEAVRDVVASFAAEAVSPMATSS